MSFNPKPYIKYGKFRMDYHMYFNIINKIKPYMTEIADFFGIEYKKLRYYHIIRYVQEALNVKIIEYSFSSKLNNIIAGSLYEKDGEIIICLNSNLKKGRRIFTILHEIKHLFIDIPLGISSHFDDQLHLKFEDKSMIEIEADTIASYMFSTDTALKEAIFDSKLSYEELRLEFGYSKKALETRLRNFLVFTIHMTYQSAQELIENYIKGKNYLTFVIDEAIAKGYYVY